MDKKVLASLPIPEPPAIDIPAQSIVHIKPWYEGGKGYNKNIVNYIYTAESLADGTLILNVFNDDKMIFRVFICADNYFNQIFPDKKITGAMFDNIRLDSKDIFFNSTYNPAENADKIIESHFKSHFWYPDKIRLWGKYPPGSN